MKQRKHIIHKHNTYSDIRINKYAVAVSVVGILFMIFRAHYWNNKWILFVALFSAVLPVMFYVLVYAGMVVEKKYPHSKFLRNLVLFLFVPLFLVLMFLLNTANEFYCQKLLDGKTKVIQGLIDRTEIVAIKHSSSKVFVYTYNYNNHNYSNNIPAEGKSYMIGEDIKVKVSTFDPTVSEVIQ